MRATAREFDAAGSRPGTRSPERPDPRSAQNGPRLVQGESLGPRETVTRDRTASGVEVNRYTTPQSTARLRFDTFRAWYPDAVGAPVELATPQTIPDDFRGVGHSFRARSVLLTRLACGPVLGRWRHELVRAAVGDSVTLATFYGPQPVHGRWRGQDRMLNSAGLAVLRRGQWSGQFRAPLGMRMAQVSVPRAQLDLPEHELSAVDQIPMSASDPMIRLLLVPMLRELISDNDALLRLSSDDLSRLWIATLTLLLGEREGRRLDPDLVAPARRRAAEEHIRASLEDPNLTPDNVGRAIGVSRRRVYELFATDDIGVAEFIRNARLDRVRVALADPARRAQPIGVLASAAGFPNQAHFSRLFRRTYGETARDYRARLLNIRD
jgi:AraC-like DNA-binding protein